MKFSHPAADVFVPDSGVAPEAALARTTHLCVAAHQDDIEIMAYHGIADCFGRPDKWFSGVIVTNGAGSSRTGLYGSYTDAQMQAVRLQEQRKAAVVGEYSIQIQLGHPSAAVKDKANAAVQSDLTTILAAAGADVVYLHQPADKHDTHIGVLAHSLAALRRLPADRRPKRVLGCEVWRDLDWMVDTDKQVLDTGRFPNLAMALVGVFDSQITGGKRYDLATAGRRMAHATYHTSHATDQYQGITWAMDLTPLVQDPTLSLADYTQQYIERFRQDVAARLAKFA
ncbi:MAG: PIG-L family deacetylase [Opitutaceae bacterium]|nr:PIG-L family deacetylase [Opitutaceae bacterium]